MHDPMSVAHEIRRPWKSDHGWRRPILTIWHVDPEKDGSDDSCDWFGNRISKEELAYIENPHGDHACSREELDERAIGYRLARRRLAARLWWKHPKWHVHHWRFQFHPWQSFKAKHIDRCQKCGEKMGNATRFGTSWSGTGVAHGSCLGYEVKRESA